MSETLDKFEGMTGQAITDWYVKNIAIFRNVCLTIYDDCDLPQSVRDCANSLMYCTNYIAQSKDDPTKFTFCNTSRDCYNHKKRNVTTLARIVNRLYLAKYSHVNMTDKDIALFEEKYFDCTKDRELNFIFLDNEDVVKAYKSKVGGHSCMTEGSSKKTLLYVENPDVVQMLIGYDTKKFVLSDSTHTLRCLLWFPEGHVVIDRIYRSGRLGFMDNDKVQDKVAEFVSKQYPNLKVVKRTHNNISTGADTYNKTFTVEIKAPSTDLWPYIDTFRYCTKIDDKTYRLSTCLKGSEYTLDNDDGSGPGTAYCCDCDDRIEDAVRHDGNDYCQECFDNQYSKCFLCNAICENSESYSVITKYVRGREYGTEENLCKTCFDDNAKECSSCHQHHVDNLIAEVEGNNFCTQCVKAAKKTTSKR